jgi:hypothetical protein
MNLCVRQKSCVNPLLATIIPTLAYARINLVLTLQMSCVLLLIFNTVIHHGTSTVIVNNHQATVVTSGNLVFGCGTPLEELA